MAYRKGGLRSGSLNAPELLKAALVGYEYERTMIVEKIAEIGRQLGGRVAHATAPSTNGAKPARRQMSAAARKSIAEAQRKRWAEFHKTHAPGARKTGAGQKSAGKAVRRMSPAARKRISEATKKRWAAYRAKKTARKVKTAGA